MAETFADALDQLSGLLHEQVAGYRALLESTRAGTEALRAQDADAFDRILAEQVETLRKLKELERERAGVIRDVGDPADREELRGLDRDLRELAAAVSRESRVSRFVIERNGAMVEARLALHRRAGTIRPEAKAGLDRIA